MSEAGVVLETVGKRLEEIVADWVDRAGDDFALLPLAARLSSREDAVRETLRWLSAGFADSEDPKGKESRERAGRRFALEGIALSEGLSRLSSLRSALRAAAERQTRDDPAERARIANALADFFESEARWLVRGYERASASKRISVGHDGEEIFRDLAESMSGALWIQDIASGTVEWANAACEGLWGRGGRELMNGDPAALLEAIVDADRSEVAAFLKDPATRYSELEYRVEQADGPRWVRSVVFPIVDADGAVARLAWISRDITERKELERRLAEEQGLVRLGEVATVVAHELKGPIASVLTGLEYLLPRLPEDSTQRRLVDEIARRVRSLLRLAEDVLRFGRPLSPRPVPLAVRTHLTKAIATLCDELRVDELPIAIGGTDLRLEFDEMQFQQVLLNLLKNAVQAAGRDGKIGVSIERRKDRCRIEIRDNGPGIPEAVRVRVFDPFFTTKSVGTGIGLALVRRIVEAHAGKVSIICPAEGGTSVSLDLPLRSPSTAHAPETP